MIRGGVADKLGNGYEALWAIKHALEVLRGRADEMRFEPFDEDAQGFEFRVNTGDKVVWHQCKRRRTAGNWTLRNLQTEGVLDDFARKLVDSNAACVFVSGDIAAELKALTEKARLVDNLTSYESALNEAETLNLGQLRAVWNVSPDIELDRLKRCFVETTTEETLKGTAEMVCSLLFRDDPSTVVDRLIGLMNRTLTQTLTTDRLRTDVDDLGLGWLLHLDPTLDAAITQATDQYLRTLPSQICAVRIDKADSASAGDWAVNGEERRLMLSGQAGCGKSNTLARIIQQARDADIPVLAFRMDRLLTASSVREIGQSVLERAESPVAALGNRYGNRRCLLIVDQVDAVSDASGRSVMARDLLLRMAAESEFYPDMRMVLACRAYDLSNDRLLNNLAEDVRTATIQLRLLDWDSEVFPLVSDLGFSKRAFTEREQRILSVPVNLQLFATIAQSTAQLPSEISSAKLFDTLVALRTREIAGLGLTWTPLDALGHIAEWMSDNQELTAPVGVLSKFMDAAAGLASAGLLVHIGNRLQFAHESFFDHVFAGHFVTSGGTLLNLLTSDEQRLFRRTQVRQILARLREQSARLFLKNLREVIESDAVRFLVKDAVGTWLSDIDAPTDAELALVLSWHADDHPLKKVADTALSGSNWVPALIRTGTMRKWLEGGKEDRKLVDWLLRKAGTSHADVIAPLLTAYWGADPARTVGVLDWFATLHPDGDIGPLESLYSDLVAAAPSTCFDIATPSKSFDLGPWTHKGHLPGARVLGLWLARWQLEFPEGHAFPRYAPSDDKYWIKEIATNEPGAFLDAVLPAFIEALAREDRAYAAGGYYRHLRVPDSEDDEAYPTLIAEAFEKIASTAPEDAAARLATLPKSGEVPTFIKLRTIAANGAALCHLLPAMLTTPEVLDTDEMGGGWRNFADAAKVALPFLGDTDRATIERFIHRRQPEMAWAIEYLREHKDSDYFKKQNPRTYVMAQLNDAGIVERAILRTIGDENLSDAARRRHAELERKFPGKPLPRNSSGYSGYVQSPIGIEPATKMSNPQWLKAMRKYSGSHDRSYGESGILGGAHQLASQLQARVKEEPARFLDLLESLPLDLNPAYAEAIVGGLREAKGIPDGGVARAVNAALPRQGSDTIRQLCWLAQANPLAVSDKVVLDFLLDVAMHGKAGEPVSRTGKKTNKARQPIREAIFNRDDDDGGAINAERGSAYEALAKGLWENRDLFEEIKLLLDRQIDVEGRNSVRGCMLHAVNSVARYDVPTAIRYVVRIAAKDLRPLQSSSGRHFMFWAVHKYLDELADIVSRMSKARSRSMRTFGRLLEVDRVISGHGQARPVEARFAKDALLRQVAAYRASGHLGSDWPTARDQSAAWLPAFFDDADKAVREESTHVGWGDVLDGPVDRSAVIRKYIASEAFHDHSDQLMHALEERVAAWPELALEGLTQALISYDRWIAGGQRGHFSTIHHLGTFLVALYRAFEADPVREKEILNLFDKYLARDTGGMRSQIAAFERD